MSFSHTTKGITLVECIVAVTILAVALAGPMTLASQSLKASRDARYELIATHLAEESIEVVHNARDNNSADDIANSYGLWMTTIVDNCRKIDGCIIDVTAHAANVWDINNALLACPAAGDCSSVNTVYFNPLTGLYRQSLAALAAPWERTIYTRSILVQPIDHPVNPKQQVRLISTVSYVGYGGKTRTVSVTDDLYNWFPPLR